MIKHIDISELNENAFQLIGQEWMLITAGDRQKCNTMTASYGSFGILFGKPVVHIYVRPERYTFHFLEEQEFFTLSYFNQDYRSILEYCGRNSGRDHDKIKKCGLTLAYTENEVPYFKESQLTIVCRKIYTQDLNRELLTDDGIRNSVYGNGGDHRMYVGEIIDIFYQK